MPDDLSIRHWDRIPLSSAFRINTSPVFPWQAPNESFTHYSIPAFDQLAGPALEIGEAIESNKTRIIEPSVLVSKLNPRKPRVLAVLAPSSNACCSTEFVCYTPTRGSDDLRFWAVYFGSGEFSDRLMRVAVGSTNSHTRVTPSETLKWQVPDVPAAEQKQIADILEALDDTIIETDVLIAKLHAIGVGMAADLFRFGIDQNGELRPPHLVQDSQIGAIPADWHVQRLDSIFGVFGGKRLPSGHSYAPEATNFRYLRVTDFFAKVSPNHSSGFCFGRFRLTSGPSASVARMARTVGA